MRFICESKGNFVKKLKHIGYQHFILSQQCYLLYGRKLSWISPLQHVICQYCQYCLTSLKSYHVVRSEKEDSIVWKGENAHYKLFLLCPSCFREPFPRNSKALKLFINPFPHNDTFWRPWETSLLKTLWEKEKSLVTSNLSFSHSVFYLFG